jgi:dipeptidase E
MPESNVSHPGHIVATGGAGFSVESENLLLEDFILSLARRQPARVCFIPTASGDAATYIAKFYRTFAGRATPTDLVLFDSPIFPRNPLLTSDLPAFIAAQDVFYVGGGNTANMLALWRLHGIDGLLRDAWQNGAVLCGVSAGMICWFESSLTDSFGGLEPLNDGLGFLSGSACPHFDGEPGRRPRYHELVASGFSAGYAADDGVGLHFIGTSLHEAVSSRPNAAAYRVEMKDGRVVEERLPTRYLGAR